MFEFEMQLHAAVSWVDPGRKKPGLEGRPLTGLDGYVFKVGEAFRIVRYRMYDDLARKPPAPGNVPY
jgi:hypothetical protein